MGTLPLGTVGRIGTVCTLSISLPSSNPADLAKYDDPSILQQLLDTINCRQIGSRPSATKKEVAWIGLDENRPDMAFPDIRNITICYTRQAKHLLSHCFAMVDAHKKVV